MEVLVLEGHKARIFPASFRCVIDRSCCVCCVIIDGSSGEVIGKCYGRDVIQGNQMECRFPLAALSMLSLSLLGRSKRMEPSSGVDFYLDLSTARCGSTGSHESALFQDGWIQFFLRWVVQGEERVCERRRGWRVWCVGCGRYRVLCHGREFHFELLYC